MVVDYNEKQLSIGKAVVGQIEKSSEELKNTIQTSIDSIKEAAMQYKVNLDGTIDVGPIDTTISDLSEELNQTSQLASVQAGFLQDYESGTLASEAVTQMIPMDELLRKKLSQSGNDVHPNVLTRTVATAGLGVFMFGEGFLSFFEDIGDAILTVGSGVTRVVGFKSASEQLKAYSDRNLSKEIVEDNDYFQGLNKTSYFDKDSGYAKVCKGVGKVTAAAVTTHVASKLWAKHLYKTGETNYLSLDATKEERAIEAYNQAYQQAKATVKTVNKTREFAQDEIKNVSKHAGSGEGLSQALVAGTAETTGKHLVKNYVTKPISEKAANVILNTNAGQRVDDFLRGNGESIEEHANEYVRSAVSNASRTIGGKTATEVLSGVGDALGIDDNPVGEVGIELVGKIAGEVINNVGTPN